MENIFENPTAQVIEGGDFDSKFLIYPLVRGYGTTLGNALKRVLLSSLPGVAIYSVKINGITNEFDSLVGLKEDIIEVIQNLKRIVFKKEQSYDSDFTAKLTLKEEGPKIVTAEDLSVVPGVVIVNPLQKICQVEAGKSIELEVNVRVGVGYSSSKENEKFLKSENEIAIDSLFSPVERVNFEIIKTMGDNDELTITVVTNGSITSAFSLVVASDLLVGYLHPLINLSPEVSFPYSNPIVTPDNLEEEDNSAVILSELPASVSNVLKRNNYFTIKQIIECGKDDLAKLRGFGPSALTYIEELFEKYNIKWSETEVVDNYESEEELEQVPVQYFKLPTVTAKVVSGTTFDSTIEVKPLVKRYATTLGNSLRRVLLSSLPGVAIFAIKIAGAEHEFQTITGVREDVMSVVQNLKKVVFRVDSRDKDFYAKFKIDKYGAAPVTANDFEKVTGIYVVNPEQEICNLAPNCHFELEVWIRIGYGYVSAEDNKENINFPEGEQRVIAIDSLFSPVERVTFQTEENIDGKSNESLSLVVETNKSLTSVDSISLAAQRFKEYLTSISNIKTKEVSVEIPVEIPEVVDESKDQTLDSPLDRLNFSRRLLHALTRANYKTLREIHDSKPEEILRIKNLGSKTYRELVDKFKSLGISWGTGKNLVFNNDYDEGDD